MLLNRGLGYLYKSAPTLNHIVKNHYQPILVNLNNVINNVITRRHRSTLIPEDLPKYRDGFNDIVELKTASETVQRLFSLKMASEKELRDVIRTYNDEKYETDLETNIVNSTFHIRMLTEALKKAKKDKHGKVFLIWAIDQRKKKLRRLQKLDVDKYMAIIKEHNIPPLQSPHAPQNKYRFRKFKINVPLKKKREIEDFEHDRVY